MRSPPVDPRHLRPAEGQRTVGRACAEPAHAVEEQGRRCLLLPGDLTDPEFCREAVERTVSALGGLNVLVSNDRPRPGDTR